MGDGIGAAPSTVAGRFKMGRDGRIRAGKAIPYYMIGKQTFLLHEHETLWNGIGETDTGDHSPYIIYHDFEALSWQYSE